MHPTVVGIELAPESPDVPIVAPPARLRVAPEQGIGDKVGRLKRSGGPRIGEQRHIDKIPQSTERTAGDAPLIGPTLQGAFDTAAIVDDQSPLLLASTTHSFHKIIELLRQQLIRAKPLTTGILFHDSADETPWQCRVDRRVAGQRCVRAHEDPVPIGLSHVRPLLGTAPNLGGVKLEVSVVVPERMELAEQEGVETLLQMPRVLLVDDDPADDEHRTASVRSGLVDKAQVQQSSHRVRAPPKRGTFCESAEEQAHGTEYSGPLR